MSAERTTIDLGVLVREPVVATTTARRRASSAAEELERDVDDDLDVAPRSGR
jgi:hypothetical protein